MVAKVSPVLAHVSPKDVNDKENQQLQASNQDKMQRPGEQREHDKLASPEQKPECEKASVIEVLTSTSRPLPINNSEPEGRLKGSVML